MWLAPLFLSNDPAADGGPGGGFTVGPGLLAARRVGVWGVGGGGVWNINKGLTSAVKV